MNRCLTLFLSSMLLAATSLPLLAPLSVQAQGTPRTFPESALRGKLVVTLPPEVSLNGKPDRLSPGARIHDTSNLLVMSGGLINRELVVNYVRDGHGLIHEVWILTPQELSKEPWPATLEQSKRWLFNPAAQAWEKR